MSDIRQTIIETIINDLDIDKAKLLVTKYLGTLEFGQLVACMNDALLPIPETAEAMYREQNILVGIESDFHGIYYAEYDKSINRIVLQRDPSRNEMDTLPILDDLLPHQNIDDSANTIDEEDDRAPF